MWRCFSILVFFCFFSLKGFSSTAEEKVFNPVWMDSLMTHKTDSAAMAQLKRNMLPETKQQKAEFSIQPLKHNSTPVFYLIFALVLLLITLLLRIIFDDFSEAMLQGVLSSKQYYVFLRTNKYDSPVPLAYIFLAKNLVLAFLVYLVLKKLQPGGGFQMILLLKVMAIVLVFSLVRFMLELLFSWAINTTAIYKAFSLQQLFIDFIWALVLLCVCIICLYNSFFYLSHPVSWFILLLSIYLVFNIFRSYQLLSNIRITYRLHFFLYICTFKILPVLLLAKYLLSNT